MTRARLVLLSAVGLCLLGALICPEPVQSADAPGVTDQAALRTELSKKILHAHGVAYSIWEFLHAIYVLLHQEFEDPDYLNYEIEQQGYVYSEPGQYQLVREGGVVRSCETIRGLAVKMKSLLSDEIEGIRQQTFANPVLYEEAGVLQEELRNVQKMARLVSEKLTPEIESLKDEQEGVGKIDLALVKGTARRTVEKIESEFGTGFSAILSAADDIVQKAKGSAP